MVSLDRDILRPTLIFVSYASNTATAAAMFFFFFWISTCCSVSACVYNKHENYDKISFHYHLTWCKTRYPSDSE